MDRHSGSTVQHHKIQHASLQHASLLEQVRMEVMEFAWSVVAIGGVVIGVLIIICGLRKKEQKSTSFSDINGILKQDWARTRNIDFHANALESKTPQLLVLRVEEKKITENAMGQDIVQLRWRLATLEEAKEIVVCWTAGNSEGYRERRGAFLKSA
jgi:hypothetical protein